MKRFILFGLFMLFAGYGLSQVVENETVIKVHSFQVLDANGKVRAELSTNREGAAFLRFFDTRGNVEWELTPKATLLPLKH